MIVTVTYKATCLTIEMENLSEIFARKVMHMLHMYIYISIIMFAFWKNLFMIVFSFPQNFPESFIRQLGWVYHTSFEISCQQENLPKTLSL